MKPRHPGPPANQDVSLLRSLDTWRETQRYEVLVLKLLQSELRALIGGAGLLGVRTATLLAWAGTVNPGEATLPRWRRPYTVDADLVRYVVSLDERALHAARELARQFGIDVETHLLARTFHWLRRIKAVHVDDPHWRKVEVPAGRVHWRRGQEG